METKTNYNLKVFQYDHEDAILFWVHYSLDFFLSLIKTYALNKIDIWYGFGTVVAVSGRINRLAKTSNNNAFNVKIIPIEISVRP